MVSRSLVLGFHGCDQAVAQRVLSNREELLSSDQPWDWLGHGIYFWEDSPARALRWAKEQAAKKSKVNTVRGFFVEGRALYPDSGFRELDHIQICVRSPEQVLGYFWPRGA